MLGEGVGRALRAVSASPAGQVCQRIIAAALGGYAMAVVLSIAIAEALPLAQFDAVMAAVLASFVIHLGIILWVFAVHSLRRMWLGLLVPMVLLSVALWLLRGSAA